MNDSVQEVKDRTDIVEIISTYLTLKKAGANYKANCPFHNEKSPSFMINPERQTFKCFGCGEGGDVFTFIEKIEGLDFYNALKMLAERAGVELKSNSVRQGQNEFRADKKTRVFEINEWAAKVYHKLLVDHPKAEKARAYLQKRGLSKETIEAFEIGYAPQSWDFLLRFLRSKGYTDQEAVEAGVATKADGGKIYDRFRGRIIFPINNAMGNTVAFTSRILEDDGKSAKYINSAESPIYIKGKTIYALDKAKMAIKEAGHAVLVEGQMDVIACHQAGFTNVVATSGTALTLDQLKILQRYAGEIYFCFDGDEAGQTAMKRAIRLALQNDITTKILVMPPPFKDPDEAIKQDRANWIDAVNKALPSLQYWIDSLLKKHPNLSIDDKKKIAKEILPEIKIIASEIEKEHYLKYLSDRLAVSMTSLSEALDKSKADHEFSHAKKEETKPVEQQNLTLIERILGLIWAEPELLSKTGDLAKQLNSSDKSHQELVDMIKSGTVFREKIKPEIAAVYDQLAMGALRDLNPENPEAITEELLYLLGRYRSEQKEETKESFARKIKQAEQAGDVEELKRLLQEFSSLIK
jgi:DNA primase